MKSMGLHGASIVLAPRRANATASRHGDRGEVTARYMTSKDQETSTSLRAAQPATTIARGKRLLFVINEAFFLLSHRRAVVRAAQEAGFEVHVAAPSHHAWAPEGFDLSDLPEQGLEVHVIPLSRRGRNPVADARTFTALFSLYRRLRPDVVHHITVKPNLYGGLAARLAGVPAVVYAVSGLGELFSGRGLGLAMLRPLLLRGLGSAFRHSNASIIVQNSEDGRALSAALRLSEAELVLIRGSGVDLCSYRVQPEPSGIPVVVLAARLIWDKGIREFVTASRALKAQGLNARFVLVGGAHASNPRTVPADTLRAWEKEGLVEWWGYRTDMPAVLAGANIVCLPSSYGEGVPKVLLEAAASGRAVVATDIAGCREAVVSGETGILVPVGDAPALAQAIRKLLAAPDARRAMGLRARRRVEAEFDERDVASRTLAVYNELLVRLGPQGQAAEKHR